MKRVHFNMTNKPVAFRTWLLTLDSFDQSDFLWLRAFDMQVRIERPTHTFNVAGSNSTHTIAGKPTYTVETTTDKQRNMLMLKFGDSAVLIQEELVLPGSISECVLSELKI